MPQQPAGRHAVAGALACGAPAVRCVVASRLTTRSQGQPSGAPAPPRATFRPRRRRLCVGSAQPGHTHAHSQARASRPAPRRSAQRPRASPTTHNAARHDATMPWRVVRDTRRRPCRHSLLLEGLQPRHPGGSAAPPPRRRLLGLLVQRETQLRHLPTHAHRGCAQRAHRQGGRGGRGCTQGPRTVGSQGSGGGGVGGGQLRLGALRTRSGAPAQPSHPSRRRYKPPPAAVRRHAPITTAAPHGRPAAPPSPPRPAAAHLLPVLLRHCLRRQQLLPRARVLRATHAADAPPSRTAPHTPTTRPACA